ncbi:MAG TPA: N-acetylmuramoyl-L-alanine amidase [Acidobacteriaceae bacterium]|jgi:N-acetylmuramoyl-L-alanine amidase|nr:N-acetylmuramoyl-L-alanine amidase [Acidobacteriaceae bacterium]
MRWTEVPVLLVLMAGLGLAQTAPSPKAPASGPLPRAPGLPPIAAPAPAAPVGPPQFVVVVDAAHGGDDTGAKIGSGVLEKDITLELAGRLRSVLKARGVEVVMTRQADTNMTPVERAQAANHAQAAACVVVHATATGSGVHLYTSSLSPGPRTAFLPWATAQAAFVTPSLKLESEIDSALAHAAVPVTLGRASVQPMDNLACPAVAVEIAPLVAGHVTTARPLTDVSYQRQVVDALAAALEQWRGDGRNQ